MASSSATSTSVYFIRHGTSEWNLLKRWQGQTDTLLAPEGQEQARLAGEALSARGVSFDAVRCSDLKRAARTAALLAARCGAVGSDGQRTEPVVDRRLRECFLGVFEGLHKEEIFGPRFAALFHRLSSLPHEARIRTAYFDGLETPLDISSRALAAASELAASFPGGTVACVTHSVILESLCAAAFHKDYESVHTHTLAWMRCSWSPAGGFELQETSGVEFVPSPDALALDSGASALPATAATSVTWRCAADARTTAVAQRAAVSAVVATAAASAVALGFGGGRSPAMPLLRRSLSLGQVVATTHAIFALGSVATAHALVACGLRASLRAAPFGLWLPRLAIARASDIVGTKEDVASRVKP